MIKNSNEKMNLIETAEAAMISLLTKNQTVKHQALDEQVIIKKARSEFNPSCALAKMNVGLKLNAKAEKI